LLQSLLESVQSFDRGASPHHPTPEKPGRIRIAPKVAVAIGALVLAAAALLIWRPRADHDHVPVVAIAAADRRSESDALARDLLVKLGGMRAATTGGVHLAAAGEAAAPADLVFEAAAGTDPRQPKADLTLKRGGDRTILWSKSFEPESRNLTDLQEQLTLNAGKVLECAVEAIDPSNARLSRDTIGLYLTACARLAEDYGADTGEVTKLFHRVVAQAPRFKAAWSKLLIAESQKYGQDESDSRWPLKADIAAARKVDPNLPEIAIAELALVPTGDYTRGWAMIDRAAKLAPESADVLSERSTLAATVGFVKDSVQDAQQAAALDPLSPGMRNAYISALIYSGRFDAAQAELRTAERIWPGSSTVADARIE
jgi:tetratricopeptide (TPR) repeat protein